MKGVSIRYISLVLAVVLSLAACAPGLQQKFGDSMFARLPGSEFILHTDIIIPPRQIRASFQGGMLLSGASEYEPRCELELSSFSDEPQTIHAGTYTVSRVLGQERFVIRQGESILVAAAGGLQLASGTSDWYMNTYQMTLQSDVYADTPDLICGGVYGFGFDNSYPSLEEMLVALGEYAKINLR